MCLPYSLWKHFQIHFLALLRKALWLLNDPVLAFSYFVGIPKFLNLSCLSDSLSDKAGAPPEGSAPLILQWQDFSAGGIPSSDYSDYQGFLRGFLSRTRVGHIQPVGQIQTVLCFCKANHTGRQPHSSVYIFLVLLCSNSRTESLQWRLQSP